MSHHKLDTNLLHHGYRSDPSTGAIAVPIYQTAAYEFQTAKQASDLFSLQDTGFIYSRMGNPTVEVFEKRLAILEGGVDALAVSSGQSAVTLAICNLAKQGDNIVASPAVYGGVYSLFKNVFNHFGIEVRFADPDTPQSWADLTDDKTRAYYGETYPNPRFKVLPIQQIADMAHAHDVPLIVDNTCAPIICRPFDHGANIIVHSTTKYITGQGTLIGGCIIDKGNFDFTDKNPLMNTPDTTYDGLVWTDVDVPSPYLLRTRATLLRDLGTTVSPNDAFLSLQNMETLTLRMEKHCDNADKLAVYLSTHPKVEKVIHTSTVSDQYKDWADRYLGGKSAMMGLYVKGDFERTGRLVESLKLFYHAANLGDNKSLIIHPASTTHSQLNAKTRESVGITENYLRISVGIEHPDDIIADFKQAFENI